MAEPDHPRTAQALRHVARRARHRPRDPDGRVHRAGRAVGLRQEHAAADHRRARGHRRQARSRSAAGVNDVRAARPRHRDGVPELRALSVHERVRQHRLRPARPQDAGSRDRGAASTAPREHARHRPPARPLPAPAVGRPAPARGDRPRHRPQCPSCSCSTSRCRNLDAQLRDEMRGEIKRLHQELGKHDDLRHPRPDRGDDAGRPHRAAAGRPDRAAGRAARAVSSARRPGSSPASWARRR